MQNYLYSRYLTEEDFDDGSRKLEYLKTYLNDEKPVDLGIRNKFPIEYFGSCEDTLRVKGSKKLIDAFDDLDKQIYDFTEKYKYVKFEGVADKRKILLNFPNQDISAHGVYNFFNDFLVEFQISRYIDYCLKNQYDDLVGINIKSLLSKNGEEEKQFRLIRDKDESWGIRALTSSDRYKNYDNNVVLYLSLLAIHKYAAAKNLSFKINNAFISDSFMHVFFENSTPIIIPDVGKVYIGIAVSNGEIRNYKYRTELRYRIVDPVKGKELAAIYNNPIFSVVHSMNLSSVELQLQRIVDLDKYEQSIIEFIKCLTSFKNLSEDNIYFLISNLLKNVSECSDISKKTKNAFKQVETDHIFKNTISLIEFFDKAKTIPTDMDEKVFVERIFHKVIKDLLKRVKEK